VKLDKRHMVASLALLACSIVYNAWVFMTPAQGARGNGGAPVLTTPSVTDAAGAATAAIDAVRIPPAPDVDLDRSPTWSRTPFAHVRPEVVNASADIEPNVPSTEGETDVTPAAILYAADRRIAMVGGKIVRPGDTLGAITIVDILPNGIVVESVERGRRTLALRLPRSTVETP
jgi:hypothetical protein